MQFKGDIAMKTWAGIKAAVAARHGNLQWDDSDGTEDSYTIFFYDGPLVFVCILYKTGKCPDTPGFNPAQNDTDVAEFEASYKNVTNKALVARTESGKVITSIWPTEGSRKVIVSHNWTDKTTWYQGATRVVQETPTATTPGTLYTLANQFVIDTYHGKLWDEDYLKDSAGNSYRPVVEVNTGSGWVAKTEVDPHSSSGDYTVNYAAGTITFSPTIPTDAQVRVTYHYAGGSTFTIAPAPGKVLKLTAAETQFASNVSMTDTVDFTAYGYVEVFAPQYCTTNGGPYPPGTKIPLRNTRYKTMYDFQAESNLALPTIPTVGGNGWRGIQNPIVVFSWNYGAAIPLYYSMGMEIRMKLQHDVPFTGEFATASVYSLSEDE